MSAAETAPSVPVDLPKRRHRVWPWVLVGVGVLVVGAGFAADAIARDLAEKAVATRVAAALEVPAGTPVAVEIGGGPVLFQAIGGSLDRVDIDIDALALGPLAGDLTIEAHGVPLDAQAPTRELMVRYAIPGDALAAVAPEISGVTIDDVAIEGGEVVATGSVGIFGLSLDLALGLTPSAVDGQLAFDPTSIRVGDQSVDADGLRDNPLLGGIADALLAQRTVCIADELPAALTLTGLDVVGDELVATLDGSGAALGGPEFTQKGACAA